MPKKREPHSVDDIDISENARKRFPNDKKAAKRLEIFAKTLNDFMADNGVDQDKLAAQTGISTGSISNYRNGSKEPGLTKIIQIAECLRVDCSYLMTGVSAENVTLAADTGLSEKSINVLRFLNGQGVNNGDDKDYHFKVISLINTVLENSYSDVLRYQKANGDWPPVDNVFSFMFDYASPCGTELSFSENGKRVTITGEAATLDSNGNPTIYTVNELKKTTILERIKASLNAIKGGIK